MGDVLSFPRLPHLSSTNYGPDFVWSVFIRFRIDFCPSLTDCCVFRRRQNQSDGKVKLKEGFFLTTWILFFCKFALIPSGNKNICPAALL